MGEGSETEHREAWYQRPPYCVSGETEEEQLSPEEGGLLSVMASKCHGGQAQEGAQASTSAGGARWGRLDMQGGPGLVRRQLERGRRCPPRPFPQASRARHRGLHCPEDHEDTGPAVSQGHATQVPMRSPRHGIAQDMQMPGTCPGCCQGDKAPGTTASTESLWLGEDGCRAEGLGVQAWQEGTGAGWEPEAPEGGRPAGPCSYPSPPVFS